DDGGKAGRRRLDLDRAADDPGSGVEIDADTDAAGLAEGAFVVGRGGPDGVGVAVDDVADASRVFGFGAEGAVVVGRVMGGGWRCEPGFGVQAERGAGAAVGVVEGEDGGDGGDHAEDSDDGGE